MLVGDPAERHAHARLAIERLTEVRFAEQAAVDEMFAEHRKADSADWRVR
jgi:hypothetical protein